MQIKYLFLFLVFLLCTSSFATLKKRSDHSILYLNVKANIDYDENGNSVLIYENAYKINDQVGADQYSIQKVNFYENDKVEILEAYTVNDTKKTYVDKDKIVTEYLASKKQGYDANLTTTVVFPNVRIGSILHFKYKHTSLNNIEPGLISVLVGFEGGYFEKLSYTYSSPTPLFFQKQDFKNQLSFKESKSKNKYEYTISLKEPAAFTVANESEYFYSNKTHLWYVLSSVKNWKNAFPKMKEKYAQALSVKNNTISQIAKKFKNSRSENVQINQILQFINSQYRYFGDWRRVEGGFIPRKIEDILSSKYGDCKDLSYLLALILKDLGFQPQIAFITRKNEDLILELSQYPTSRYFNHAVVYLKTAHAEYWLDPTNSFQYAEIVPYDIAGKYAFLFSFSENESGLVQTPFLDYRKNIFSSTGEISKNIYKGQLTWEGINASYILSRYWNQDAAAMDFRILESEVSSYFRVKDFSFGKINFKETTYSPVTKNFTIETYDHFTQTSEGKAFGITPSKLRSYFESDLKGRISDMDLGVPSTKFFQLLLKNEKLKGSNYLNCKADTDYFSYERKVEQTDQGVLIRISEVVKTQYIYNKEIKTALFQKQIQDAFPCLVRYQVVLEQQ